jgi:2-polyprenyl-3-methyl-5-hydroxy-6-metoxy-1,4-benzoquinol methylase
MKKCPLCGGVDLSKKFEDRIDYEFNISNKLHYYKCGNSVCRFVFVYPLPSNDEIHSFYKKYTTHNLNINISHLNILARINKVFKSKTLSRLFVNSNINDIKVLDFGCGNGNFLIDLKRIGIKNLFGYDFDSKAIDSRNLDNLVLFDNYGLIAKYGNYDYIFLNHVVEHLPDAKFVIENLSKVLNKSGKIVIRTPNSDSVLSFLFNDSWRGWETPRHLGIFNFRNIDSVNSTLFVERKWTSNIMFTGIFHESIRINILTKNFIGKIIKHILSYIIYTISILINGLFKKFGEEICIIYVKSDSNKVN